jgi:AbrB family looped-hinge helix DNA binding protein
MGEMSASVEVSLGRQGRLVIPAPLRRVLELEEGDRLMARFAQVPVECALVDELIAERREQFSIEDGRRESV